MSSRTLTRVALSVLLVSPVAIPAVSPGTREVAPAHLQSEPWHELPAVLLPGGSMPEYPTSLRASRAGARVVLGVVVQADGHVDTSRVRVLLGDSAVAAEVRRVLPTLRYTPKRLVTADAPCAVFNGSMRVCGRPGRQVRSVASSEVLVVDLPPFVVR